MRSLPALVLAAAAGAAVTYLLRLVPRSRTRQRSPEPSPPRAARHAPSAAALDDDRCCRARGRLRGRRARRRRSSRATSAQKRPRSRRRRCGRSSSACCLRATRSSTRRVRSHSDASCACRRRCSARCTPLGRRGPGAGARCAGELDDPVAATDDRPRDVRGARRRRSRAAAIAADLPNGAERGFIVGAIAAGAEANPPSRSTRRSRSPSRGSAGWRCSASPPSGRAPTLRPR